MILLDLGQFFCPVRMRPGSASQAIMLYSILRILRLCIFLQEDKYIFFVITQPKLKICLGLLPHALRSC